ncbi:lytic murein transglycosylase [Pseudomonas putida S11]|nr:lytic murein transglycosylase [Pseudomonas putida S11]
MRGSWAGAMGQTQFIPTTYNTHAVDFDGDGRRDIWNSTADALASTAHYLQSSGWKRGQPWGFEVQVPPGFDYWQADGALRKPVSEWLAMGVKLPAGTQLPVGSNQLSAALLLPAGARGPAFLVLDNFRAILKYNNSSSYALAVSLLGDRFTGWGFIAGSWPKEDLPLSRSERMELQNLLNSNGHEAGNADGIIGANTRKAIRNAQQGLGWPADGYPDPQAAREPASAVSVLGPLRGPSQASQLPPRPRCSQDLRSTCRSWLAGDGLQSSPDNLKPGKRSCSSSKLCRSLSSLTRAPNGKHTFGSQCPLRHPASTGTPSGAKISSSRGVNAAVVIPAKSPTSTPFTPSSLPARRSWVSKRSTR